MEKLPVELVSKIVEHIGPPELSSLQLVSRRLFEFCRDNSLWRRYCYEARKNPRENGAPLNFLRPEQSPAPVAGHGQGNAGNVLDVITAGQAGNAADANATDTHIPHLQPGEKSTLSLAGCASQWDPSYEGEKVDWFSEYVARNVPISVEWLQEPPGESGQDEEDGILGREVKGMGLMKDYSYAGSDKIVAPLDDGAVCVWDLNRSTYMKDRNSRGKISGISRAGILMKDLSRREDSPKSVNIDFISVGECVSVDSFRHTAYIAVGSMLNEVDLSTLQVVSQKKYPWSVFALSQETEYSAPLTVGTAQSLHVYDSRIRSEAAESRLYSPPAPDNCRYVSLLQPIPISILHPPLPNINSILIAGRFSAILSYDRRNLSGLLRTTHSGASLCSLAAIPTSPRPYSSMHPELQGSHTVVACGEYKGRGSLEMLPISAPATTGDFHTQERSSFLRGAICQNRQSASGSKLLSVAAHGTRIVFTDADGNIKWVERDGRTEVRRWNLNMDTSQRRKPPPVVPTPLSILDSDLWFTQPTSSSEMVRKILPTGFPDVLDDELLIWTGDRIGRIRFSRKPGHDWNSDTGKYHGNEEEGDSRTVDRGHHRDPSSRGYSEAVVRESLYTHRNELSWMGNFGTGN
ncbi:hypothetical protein FQN53_005795 [Emmonsiellopsis sp. PD_33]|nr:hypothetical protein FQN53_005795 [Emmonsiellopsis sp. PD_33]